jgi:hypothetical protein
MRLPQELKINAYDPETDTDAVSPVAENADLWARRNAPRPLNFLDAPEHADKTNWRHPEVGWGLIVPTNPDCKGEEAETLADYAQAKDPIVDLWEARGRGPVFRYDPNASDRLYLIRRARDGKEVLLKGGPVGTADGALPRYLLIYGDPAKIPWDIQYELQENKRCCVGRLPFEGKDAANYVRAVCSDFKSCRADKGAAVIWSPVWSQESESGITRIMRDLVAAPVYRLMKVDRDLVPVFIDGAEQNATIALLTQELAARHPALVISTSHGQTGPLSDLEALGASLGVPIDQVKAALKPEELLQNWSPGGAIWYALACCSAGSDGDTNFRGLLKKGTTADRIVTRVAELGSRIAPLPLKLLQAEQPLRAFVGHVEPTFDFSLSYPENLIPTTALIQEALYNALYQKRREPIGLAMRRWWGRIGEMLGVFARSHDEYERGNDVEATPDMVWSRLAAQDVKTTVILGDPAVTLPV